MAFLNETGLGQVWEKIKTKISSIEGTIGDITKTKVDKVDGKGLSTNDYTTNEKTKLAGIATGATKVIVDSALSSTSTNAIQNKVVANMKTNIEDQLSDKPSKTGDGASGTWGISIGGNAATASILETARTFNITGGASGTAQSFNGSKNVEIPVTAVKESYLTWGGKNFSGSYGCIDAAMVPELSANRLMFGKAAGIAIKYSTDAGNTWNDYGATDSDKVALFSSGKEFNVGKATKDTLTTNCMLQVIIDTDLFRVYTELNKFIIYISTNGSNGCYCTIDASLESTPTTFTTFADRVPIYGWSGYNVINISPITTYGNTKNNQYGLIRFTFGFTSIGNTNYSGLSVSKIMGFGGVGWIVPSNMAKNGHLYSYDSSQNATFPAKVTASNGGFVGNISGNASTATKATQDSAGQQINTTYIKGLSVSGKTITYIKGDGTTGTITMQDASAITNTEIDEICNATIYDQSEVQV